MVPQSSLYWRYFLETRCFYSRCSSILMMATDVSLQAVLQEPRVQGFSLHRMQESQGETSKLCFMDQKEAGLEGSEAGTPMAHSGFVDCTSFSGSCLFWSLPMSLSLPLQKQLLAALHSSARKDDAGKRLFFFLASQNNRISKPHGVFPSRWLLDITSLN